MSKGKVKWFSEQKGFGFILEETGKEVFVHFSEIQGDGFKTLVTEDEVEFEVVNSTKGLQAKSVKKI